MPVKERASLAHVQVKVERARLGCGNIGQNRLGHAGPVAAWWTLYLDDVGSESGEHTTAKRASDALRSLDDD